MLGKRTRTAALAVLLAGCASNPAPGTLAKEPPPPPAPMTAPLGGRVADLKAIDTRPVDATMGVGVPRDPAATPGPQLRGYLTAETTPDATAIIPPAPRPGEARNDSDWAVFRATRSLKGSDRWQLAINDDSYRIDDVLKDFSCAAGASLTSVNAPTLARIMQRASVDAANAAAATKEVYKRRRPYLDIPGEICIARSEGLEKSFDYPSGHSSASWVEGLLLAQLAPDRSTKILARARAYGESRVVCGVHNYSSVEAGRTNAASVFAALQASEAFKTDMVKAAEELKTARAAGAPNAATCQKEATLTAPLVIP